MLILVRSQLRKIKLVALLLFSYICSVTINVLWPFLTMPWDGLQYVIAVFPDHTHLLFLQCSHNERINLGSFEHSKHVRL